MEGLTRGPYEIFEIIIVILLLLTISSAIIFTNNPDLKNNKLINEEVNLVSAILIGDSRVIFEYPDITNILLNGNNLETYIRNLKVDSKYIGNRNVKLKLKNGKFILISSNLNSETN